MSLLKTIEVSEATGVVKQIYDGFEQNLGKVPNVIKFHSISQTIYPRLMDLLNQFAQHSRLDPVLITYLRVIIPYRYNGEYCVKFQSHLVKMYGEPEENIEIAKKDPSQLPMDEKRKTLLLFALDLIDGKHENIEAKLEKVKEFGWTDEDIYEYCFLGGLHKGMMPLVKGFKVEHDY